MSRFRHVWLFLILAGLLQIASCSRIGAKGRVNHQLDAIRQAGQPLTMTDLDKWYREPPSEDNAAPLLEDCFARLQLSETETASLPVLGKEKLPEIGLPLTPATRQKISQLLSKNQPVLTLLHQAAGRKECRFPIVMKGGAADLLLPHLAKMLSCVKLLELEAISNAESSNATKMVQSLITSFRVARLLVQEPFLISQLVRFAIDNTSCSTLERTFSTIPLSDDQLASLLSVVQEGENSPGLTRGLIGDRCLGISILQMPPKEREALVLREAKDLGNGSTEKSSWDDDFACYLQAMDEAIAASKMPFPKSLERGKGLGLRVAEAKRKHYLYSAMTLDSFVRLFPKQAQHEARLRCAEAALGVQRYRLAHRNSLPTSLEETVPEFLKAVPSDPFDGTPLQYRRESAIRYSISSSTDDPKGKDLTFNVIAR